MPNSWRALPFVLLLCLVGCHGSSTPRARQTPSQLSNVEAAVQAAAAKVLKVKPTDIPMEIPFGKPPLKADDLDLVEIVIEVEDRLGVDITDDDLERSVGSSKESELGIKLTPRILAKLAGKAKRRK